MMHKKLYSVLFVALLLILGSCEKDFEELNTNPNQPTETSPDYLFNYVAQHAAGDFALYDINHRFLLKWVQQSAVAWGNSTWPPYEAMTASNITDMWNYFYTSILLNTNKLIDITANKEDMVNKHALARIMKIYTMHRVTDLWGDVPYSEAGAGYTEERMLMPQYDKQELIYESMLEELKEAAADIDPENITYEYDLIYGKGIDEETDTKKQLKNWRKFANSLRLRLAIRSGNQQVVTEIMNENNLIASNEESATFKYLTNDGDWSPYYEMYQSSQNKINIGKISELMVDTMRALNDPRLPKYAEPNQTNDSIVGAPNLLTVKESQAMGVSTNGTSRHGDFIFAAPDWEKPLVSYAEVSFLKAEAALNGWGATNAQAETFYNEGIRASMHYYQVPDTSIEAYLEGPAAFNPNAADPLEQIITQKWLALYFQGIELFSEYRRTGYPEFRKYELELNNLDIESKDLVPLSETALKYPQRLPYPEKEADFNKANYNEAVSRQGPDDLYTKIWWSK